MVIQDRFTKWLDNYPSIGKTGKEIHAAFQDFVSSGDVVEEIYSDGSGELESAAKKINWRHNQATPNRPQTNGVAERAVRRVLDGTRTYLFESGLSHDWWREASRFYCFLRNIHDLVGEDKKTPHLFRFKHEFLGMKLPFGCEVCYKPGAKKEVNELMKFGERTMQGIFMGYHLHAGGKWSGEYLVVDVNAFTTAASSADIYVHRVKEVVPKTPICFPVKEGTIKATNFGRAHEDIEADVVLGESNSQGDNAGGDPGHEVQKDDDSARGDPAQSNAESFEKAQEGPKY